MALIRIVSPMMQAALDSGHFYPVIMVHLDWPDGAVFAHSGVGSIGYQGNSWLGVGRFGSIQLPEEAEGLTAGSASFRLIGVPPEIFDRLNDPIRNRSARVLFGCVTERAGNVLVGNPVEIFTGYMDSRRYVAGKEGAETTHGIELTAATGPSARASASIFHSNEDQTARYPADTLFRLFINNEAESLRIQWPEN